MTRVDKMRQSRLLPVVSLIKVIKKYSVRPNILICTFEGDDAKYYGVRIDPFLNGIVRENIVCKGKKNLILLREKIESHDDLSKVKILYFADRDFDFTDKTNNNIYFTPCYSIENLFVVNSVLKRILVDEFGYCGVKDIDEIDKTIEIYNKLLTEVSGALLDLNAWIMCQNLKAEQNDSVKLNLNSCDLKDFLDFDLDSINLKYDYATLRAMFPSCENVPLDDIESAKNVIRKSGVIESSRGKYLLEFFRIFLVKFREDAGKRVKSKLTISKNNIISDLSQYAVTPSCLTNFLRRNLDSTEFTT